MAAVLMSAHQPASCPTCGVSSDTATLHDHTELLESELRNLTEKYLTVSNQLRELQEHHRVRPVAVPAPVATPRSQSADHTATSPEARPAGLTRFASTFRLPATLSASSSSNTLGAGDLDGLQRELAKETAAREEAERKASVAHTELEDLTAQLFEQANQMVASERKANARLGERVAVLEQRDKEKARRLERIEVALRRIERVRSILEKG